MRLSVSPSQHIEQVDAPGTVRLGETALAFILAVGLVYTTLTRGDNESYVVPISDLETGVVLSLLNVNGPARDLAVGLTPVDTTPAAASDLPLIASTLSPATDLLRGTGVAQISAQAIAKGVAREFATVVGIASSYNPFRRAPDVAVAPTASGETYDPDAWTAAIQIDLRQHFGGVRYGRLYRPTFALVERGDKRAIVRINDVGPLRPGRVIDLNERSMRYFDPSLRLGLLHDTKITLLPGDDWTPGPVGDATRIGLAIAM